MPSARIGSIELYYEEQGQGFPVVFAHGFTGSHADWASPMAALSQRFRVVAMDHRGHGRSQAPSSPSDYSASIMAHDIRGLLEHLGIEECCLVGQE